MIRSADTHAGRLTRARVLTAVVVLVALLPPAAYLYVGQTWAIDAPLLDDYDVFLDFISDLRERGTLGDRLRLLFEPHNEHVVAFARAASVVLERLQGRIDFRTLSLFGNLGLLGVGGLLCFAAGRDESRPSRLLAALPVSFLLFQPQAFDVLHWPTASIAGNFVVIFGLSTFLFLERRSTPGLILAIPSAILAVCTQGNGLLVPFVVLTVLVLNTRWRAALIWGCVSLLVLPLALARGLPVTWPGATGDRTGWLDGTLYFLNFLGAAPQAALPGLGLPAAVSVCLCFLFFARRRLFAERPFVFAGLVFVLLSILFNTLARWRLGPDYPGTQPRYCLYSILVLILCHLGLRHLIRAHRRRLLYDGAVLAVAAVFCVVSFGANTPKLRAEARLTGRGMAYWSVTGRTVMRSPVSGTYGYLRGSAERTSWTTPLAYPDQELAARILERAESHGIYRPTASGLRTVLDRSVKAEPAASADWAPTRVARARRSGDFCVIEGAYRRPQEDTRQGGALLILIDGANLRAFTTERLVEKENAGPDVPFRCILPRALVPDEIDTAAVLPGFE